MNENLDTTINNICEWIDTNLKNTISIEEARIVPEMVKALADLLIARANII